MVMELIRKGMDLILKDINAHNGVRLLQLFSACSAELLSLYTKM